MLLTALGFPEDMSHCSVLALEIQVFLRVAPTMHSFYPWRSGGWGKYFQQFCGRGRGWLKGGVCQFLEGRSRFLEKANINFASRILFDLLFTCRLKDIGSLVIFHLHLTYFVLLEYFNSVSYFINS